MAATGEARRNGGIDRVLANEPHQVWRREAERVINELIRGGEPFTSDDVHARLEHLDVAPHHPNTLPGMIGGRALNGDIVRLGHRRTARPSGHARTITVWVSNHATLDGEIAIGSDDTPADTHTSATFQGEHYEHQPEVVDDPPRNSTERIEALEAALDEVGQFLLDVQVNGGKVNRSELRGAIRDIRRHIELLG